MENSWKNYRKIIVILLSIFFIQIISQDAYGLTLTTEIKPTGNAWENQTVDCLYAKDVNTWVQSTAGTGAWSCNKIPTTASFNIAGIRTHATIPVENGKYYQALLILRSNVTGVFPSILWNFNQSDDFDFVTVEEILRDNQSEYFSWNCTASQDCYNTGAHEQIYSKMYIVTLRSNTTGNVRFQLGNSTSTLVMGSTSTYVFGMRKIVEYETADATEQAEQKTEEASNEGEENSAQADQDNEQASENVIGVISDIVGAFNTAPTNCTLPADLGNINMGNINLCQGKPGEMAQIINIVGSIIIVYACYRVARNIFRIWITISAFAQGNGKGNTD